MPIYSLTALNIATAVVQFVDYGTKLLKTASEIYSEVSDKNLEEVDAELITTDLEFLLTRLRKHARQTSLPPLTKEEATLEDLRGRCEGVGRDLMQCFGTARKKAKQQSTGKGGRLWLSFSYAVRLMWKREDIETLQKRMGHLQNELNLRVNVTILDLVATKLPELNQQNLRTIELISDTHQQIIDISTRSAADTHILVKNVFHSFEKLFSWIFLAVVIATFIPMYWSWSDRKLISRKETVQLHRDVIDWLSPLDFSSKQQDILNDRCPGTGDWFLKSQEFNEWLIGRNQTLWLDGIPGSGKTVIVSIAIDHLQRYYRPLGFAIAYIYCDYKGEAQQSPESFISNIIKQLVQTHELSREMRAFYADHINRKVRPNLNELTARLRDEINRFSSVYLIVDALDEFPGKAGSRARLLKELRLLVPFLKLMVTSQPHINITQQLSNVRRIEVLAQDQDVRRYLEARLSDTTVSEVARVVEGHALLQSKIIDTLVEKANGMFLLARLHMDALASKVDRRSIWRALEDLPIGLQDAHQKAIERIESQNKDAQELALRTLSFLSYALRPITLSELQHALAIEIGASYFDGEGLIEKEFILTACAGLVVLQQESNIIRFVHYSTQEFFRTIRKLRFPDAQLKIAHACLTFISYDHFKGWPCSNQTEIQSFDAKYPFYDYAATYWGDHSRGETEIALQTEILQFLERDSHMFCATQALIAVESGWPYANSYILTKPLSPLWVAASFGLEFIVETLLQSPIDVNVHSHYESRQQPGDTVLQAASDNGHTQVVRQLLLHGANPNDCCGEHDSSLIAAAFHGHIEVVRLLLDAGATVDKSAFEWNALGAASYSGHEDTVAVLLENGADINEHQGWGTGCALQAASISGQEGVVRLLLANGADVNTLGGGRLGASIRSGKKRNDSEYMEKIHRWANDDIWRSIRRLDALDDAFAGYLGCENPLHCAAFYGHLGVANLLINAGAEIDHPGEFWGTALQAASLMGNLDMMQFLIEAGASVTAPGLALGDALQAASLYGYEDGVQMLLERGATVRGNGLGQFYNSALQAAALRGHTRLARRLLQEYGIFRRFFVLLCDSVVNLIPFIRESGRKWCYS